MVNMRRIAALASVAISVALTTSTVSAQDAILSRNLQAADEPSETPVTRVPDVVTTPVPPTTPAPPAPPTPPADTPSPIPPTAAPVTTPAPAPPATPAPTPSPIPPTVAPVVTPAPEPVVTPTPETPAPQTPAPETPTPPVTETPVSPPPVTETPAPPLPPVTETPAPPPPVTNTPAPPPPVTETPAPPPPVTNTPAPPPPVTETPAPPPPVTPVPPPVTPAPPVAPNTTTPSTPPPQVTVVVGIETNTPSVTKTDAKDEDRDSNKQDIIMFNSTARTDAPKVNPFEIKEIEKATEKPVVLDIREDEETQAPKKYVRGDVVADEEVTVGPDSSRADGAKTTTSVDAARERPNVIGGRRRNLPTDADAVLSQASATFHDFLRYAACAFAGISVALLLFFHYVSLDASLSWASAVWSPNTWEFLLYVGYLQQMASVSQLTLLKTPYYLWDYADSFAWTNFLIPRPIESDTTRRLETIVLGGIVAYADRLGITESKVLFQAVIGFVIIFSVLLVLFLIVAVLAKRKAEQALSDPSNLDEFTQSVHRLRSASIRTLGLCVLIWYFALYPLSLFASFEISMQIQAKSIADALALAIISLVVVCFGVLAWSGRVILHKRKDELLQFESMATWGSLYAEYTYRSRMFFILGALVQIATGVIVGSMDADPTQLIAVIVIESVYLGAVFVMSPFAETLVLYFTYALGLLKIVNFCIAFSFLNSNSSTGLARNRAADAFIGINTIVIIAWFVRQLIVFSTYIRAWSNRSSYIEDPRRHTMHVNDSTAKYETRSQTDSEVYDHLSTGRHGDSALPPAGATALVQHPANF